MGAPTGGERLGNVGWGAVGCVVCCESGITVDGGIAVAFGGVALAGVLAYVKFRLRTPAKECSDTVEFRYARCVAFCVA